MSEIPPTPPAPAGDPTPPTPPVEPPNPVRQLREAHDAQKQRAEAAEAKLKDIERAQMAEVDRLKAELGDKAKLTEEMARLRDENGRFVTAIEAQYQAELLSVPEDKRLILTSMTQNGSWDARLALLRQAKALIGGAPLQLGTVTQPAGGPPSSTETPPPPVVPYDPAKNPPSWDGALSRPKKAATV